MKMEIKTILMVVMLSANMKQDGIVLDQLAAQYVEIVFE